MGTKWQGVPTGYRIRVPLAGMPLMSGVRNSGQIPLPSWVDASLPPHMWKPPSPSFEDQTRQIEMTRLIAGLKPLEQDVPSPQLITAAKGARIGGESVVGGWDAEDLEKLATELAAIESQAAHRVEKLLKMRSNLHTVAHGELGIRTRRREEPAAAAPTPPIEKLVNCCLYCVQGRGRGPCHRRSC